jgi:hypothetical protein
MQGSGTSGASTFHYNVPLPTSMPSVFISVLPYYQQGSVPVSGASGASTFHYNVPPPGLAHEKFPIFHC